MTRSTLWGSGPWFSLQPRDSRSPKAQGDGVEGGGGSEEDKPPGSQLVPPWGQVGAKHESGHSWLPLRPLLTTKPYAQGPEHARAELIKPPGRNAGWWSRRGVLQPGDAGMCKHRLTAERAWPNTGSSLVFTSRKDLYFVGVFPACSPRGGSWW